MLFATSRGFFETQTVHITQQPTCSRLRLTLTEAAVKSSLAWLTISQFTIHRPANYSEMYADSQDSVMYTSFACQLFLIEQ